MANNNLLESIFHSHYAPLTLHPKKNYKEKKIRSKGNIVLRRFIMQYVVAICIQSKNHEPP